MIRGVIFDMDGVVIDSGTLIFDSWEEVFKKEFKISLTKEEVSQELGRNLRDIVQHFIDKYNLDISNRELHTKIVKAEERLAHTVILKPGIEELMKKLKDRYKMALATGASREMAVEYM